VAAGSIGLMAAEVEGDGDGDIGTSSDMGGSGWAPASSLTSLHDDGDGLFSWLALSPNYGANRRRRLQGHPTIPHVSEEGEGKVVTQRSARIADIWDGRRISEQGGDVPAPAGESGVAGQCGRESRPRRRRERGRGEYFF
jgi:hypothetical protein